VMTKSVMTKSVMTKNPKARAPSRADRAAAVVADPRWARVLGRDASNDGQFVYSVASTGVYCRPSCGARPPRPENVEFHPDAATAERAGFRPCKRCRPTLLSGPAERAQTVADLCRFIDAAPSPPPLDQLARRAGLSRYHLHRVFKAVTGVTPRAYAAARRAERLRDELSDGESVTSAIYAAGFNSQGRFYESSDRMLGMTASSYKRGGDGLAIRFAVGDCSLGAILVASSERGVCAILMGSDAQELVRDLEGRFPNAELIGGDAAFEGLVARVVGFVEAPRLGLDLPLDVRGTVFQQRVWCALADIPAGTTASYAELAARIGAPKSVRAVARACAQNPLAVAIPCHRVVRSDGALSGYRWGIERKQALLEREAASSHEDRRA
jgi:AraC family transcriptional regulator, regulatory protein of adaptative response / methylated-DNA-[protein]-cysteine methyltransferase